MGIVGYMVAYEAHEGVFGCGERLRRRNASNKVVGGSPDRVGQGRPIGPATE